MVWSPAYFRLAGFCNEMGSEKVSGVCRRFFLAAYGLDKDGFRTYNQFLRIGTKLKLNPES